MKKGSRISWDGQGAKLIYSKWPPYRQIHLTVKFLSMSLPVPCLPPQYVTYDVPGLTMLLAKWKPVPEHCRNGIILGYRVKYRRLNGNPEARIENTTADVLYAFLYDLDIYANYSIEIFAFTRKGEGNATVDLALPDTLGERVDERVQNYSVRSLTYCIRNT